MVRSTSKGCWPSSTLRTKTGLVAALFTLTDAFVRVALTLPVIAGSALTATGALIFALTVPVTGRGVFVTVTGIAGVGGAAAMGTRLGLAPTVPVVITTATPARTNRPSAIEILFFSGYIVLPPSKFCDDWT